ncbi:transporter substrate-binding domain-containing protein, partial [Bacillus nakamurai]
GTSMQSTLNSTYSKLALATVCAVSMGLTACQKPAEKTEGAAASQPAASASTGNKIRIATEGAYKPFNYTNADGTLGGYDVDVAKAVCAQAKLDCEIVAQDWDGILPGLMARENTTRLPRVCQLPQSVQRKWISPRLILKTPWFGSLPKMANSTHKRFQG